MSGGRSEPRRACWKQPVITAESVASKGQKEQLRTHYQIRLQILESGCKPLSYKVSPVVSEPSSEGHRLNEKP